MASLVSEAEVKGMGSVSKVHTVPQEGGDGAVNTTGWAFALK